MESKMEKLDLIRQAVQEMMNEKMNKRNSSIDNPSELRDDEDEDDLLSRLLIQVESIKSECTSKKNESSELHPPATTELEKTSEATCDASITDVVIKTEEISREITKVSSQMRCEAKVVDGENKTDEIAKDLKKVKRQNFVTHCLLSAMIVVTVVWQVSEVSLVLKVKDGVNHPFRSLGSALAGMLKRPSVLKDRDEESSSSKHDDAEGSLLGSLPEIELPSIEFIKLGFRWQMRMEGNENLRSKIFVFCNVKLPCRLFEFLLIEEV